MTGLSLDTCGLITATSPPQLAAAALHGFCDFASFAENSGRRLRFYLMQVSAIERQFRPLFFLFLEWCVFGDAVFCTTIEPIACASLDEACALFP